jgi:threonine synthase
MDLVCSECGRTYAPGSAWRCACGTPLSFAERPVPAGGPPESVDRDRGLWAFDSFLPVDRQVTLGEGWTPLVDAPQWDATVKLEYLFPTGSFKDRGAATTVSRAVELGVDRVVEDSSGNAGLAIATFAARAGITAEIFVPHDAKLGTVQAIARTGATVRRIEGSRQDVTDACIERVEGATGEGEHATASDAWYASHAWNPAFFAGTATFAYEVAAQRGWTPPDAIVTPLGHGTLFLGAYRGFEALQEAGWIESMPRLLGAQAAGVAPIASELHGSDSTERNDVADGIQIRRPARREQILEAIDATDGDAIAVSAAATEREHDRLARAGFHVEPTCATATAALEAYRERGVINAGDDVIVALTGSGLKTL